MMSPLRLGLIVATVLVWTLLGIIQFGKLHGLYEVSIGLWLATLILLAAGISLNEREKKKPQNSTKQIAEPQEQSE